MTDDRFPGDACPSCDVLYVEHLGMTGTCAELQQLKKLVARKTAALSRISSLMPTKWKEMRELAKFAKTEAEATEPT